MGLRTEDKRDSLSSHARVGTAMSVPNQNFASLIALTKCMPRNGRVVAPGVPYHITRRGTNREPRSSNEVERRFQREGCEGQKGRPNSRNLPEICLK